MVDFPEAGCAPRGAPLAGVPVVIVSALGRRRIESEARVRGAQEILEKPVDFDGLLATVARYSGP